VIVIKLNLIIFYPIYFYKIGADLYPQRHNSVKLKVDILC